MAELEYPAIGRRVRVRTKPYRFGWMNEGRPFPPEGIVAYPQPFNPPNSLRLVQANNLIGESVIDWERVVSIEYLDAGATQAPVTPVEEPTQTAKPALPEYKTWSVAGSKKGFYTVTKDGSNWSCTCVAGGFGRTCKHVKKIIEETA